MSRLTEEERNALPDEAFALPGRRYPIHDAAHARDALTRASAMLHEGYLSPTEYETVVRRARAVLGED
ncbi:hypothetical protein HLH36_02195 [Gluconacetobacter aggeris]|uniref:Uncharacterized protein n=2 Tax=Gluconacetobacter TaxID=89583 RepID=A0A7W4IQN3_9PROT|nr:MULTISPECIES: hypothetical protein [Gluconacetobacter]MBB2167178.1 hypothetical protein [Gluconacetobacter aggeris]MBB2178316.1 hypothetical protein [Gluconacetobacter tumulicola]